MKYPPHHPIATTLYALPSTRTNLINKIRIIIYLYR